MAFLKNLFMNISIKRKAKKYNPDKLNGYLADTNILIGNVELISQYKDEIVIPSHVLREVEHLELTKKSDKLLQYQIRRFKKLSRDVENYVDLKDYKFYLRKDWDKSYVDNLLVQICLERNLGMLTNDVLLRNKCKLYGITVVEPETSSFIEHKGFKEVYVTQKELSDVYLNLEENSFDLLINEYIVFYDYVDNSLLDIMKWSGKSMISLQDKKGRLNSGHKTLQFGDFTPRDEQQIMAVDSILNNTITSLRGQAGSGKSLITLSTAWKLVESEGYKLVIFVNPVPTRDAQELGFYKGDRLDKLMQTAVGTMLKSKFGDETEILKQIQENKLDILPFVDLRGFDTGNKTICWVLEGQNLTSELLKLGIQRLGEGSKMIVDGDFHQQIDKDVYTYDNGMKRMSEVFRGNELYGEVELQNVHRSKVASIAEEM